MENFFDYTDTIINEHRTSELKKWYKAEHIANCDAVMLLVKLFSRRA